MAPKVFWNEVTNMDVIGFGLKQLFLPGLNAFLFHDLEWFVLMVPEGGKTRMFSEIFKERPRI